MEKSDTISNASSKENDGTSAALAPKPRRHVALKSGQTTPAWNGWNTKPKTGEQKNGASASRSEDFPSLDAVQNYSKRDMKQIHQKMEDEKRMKEEKLRQKKQKEQQKSEEKKKQHLPEGRLEISKEADTKPNSKGRDANNSNKNQSKNFDRVDQGTRGQRRFDFRRDRDRQRYRSNKNRRNRGAYRGRGRGGYRGRGGRRNFNRDNNMHAMNTNFNYYSAPMYQMGYPNQPYFIHPGQAPPHFQFPNGANPQMGMQMPYPMYPPGDMQHIYSNQPYYGMMGQQYGGSPGDYGANPGFPDASSETPNELSQTEEGKTDDPTEGKGSDSERKAAPTATDPDPLEPQIVIPKTIVRGVIVCNKPMVISAQEECEIPKGPYMSLVVECVATGTTHNDRAVAHVAVVDEDSEVVLNIYIRPKAKIRSYLGPVTKLDRLTLNKYGFEWEEAKQTILDIIPEDVCLVGHNIARHLHRLGLKKGVHYRDYLDLGECWRVWNKNFSDYTKFSLAHEAQVLLKCRGSGGVPHDAILQMKVFQLYLKERDDKKTLQIRRHELMDTPIEKAIHKLYPTIDGVCMGLRKNCKCGASFEDWENPEKKE